MKGRQRAVAPKAYQPRSLLCLTGPGLALPREGRVAPRRAVGPGPQGPRGHRGPTTAATQVTLQTFALWHLKGLFVLHFSGKALSPPLGDTSPAALRTAGEQGETAPSSPASASGPLPPGTTPSCSWTASARRGGRAPRGSDTEASAGDPSEPHPLLL